MKEFLAFVVGVVFAVTAFGLVAAASCFLFLVSEGGTAFLTVGGLLGIAAACGAGYLGAWLVLRKRD